eukprot:CAMPEP_0202957218 /NCGR_PEP_ID=MMETSP1396-20130829/1649_1 /ASSEMBLY_ACC=CAM_ASM_000872 /TAXON_ID= /ORGANISM="Pseudokeronopsis sp., Strain Brazil" /LENGTH=33 /DNA_ID= /DNA_START= /DNA_END= /DNA_ORIENTATION=
MKATPNQIEMLVNEINQNGAVEYENFLNYCFLS